MGVMEEWRVGLRARGERGGGRTYLSLIWGPIRSVLIGLSVTFRMEELLLAVKQRGGGRGSRLRLHWFRFRRSLDGSCVTIGVLVFLRAAPLLGCLTVCASTHHMQTRQSKCNRVDKPPHCLQGVFPNSTWKFNIPNMTVKLSLFQTFNTDTKAASKSSPLSLDDRSRSRSLSLLRLRWRWDLRSELRDLLLSRLRERRFLSERSRLRLLSLSLSLSLSRLLEKKEENKSSGQQVRDVLKDQIMFLLNPVYSHNGTQSQLHIYIHNWLHTFFSLMWIGELQTNFQCAISHLLVKCMQTTWLHTIHYQLEFHRSRLIAYNTNFLTIHIVLPSFTGHQSCD